MMNGALLIADTNLISSIPRKRAKSYQTRKGPVGPLWYIKYWCKRMRNLAYKLAAICAFLSVLLFCASFAYAANITGPEVRLDQQGIYVAAGVRLEPQEQQDIREGIQKDIDIFIDLFRVWRFWPDEFVLGTKYTQTLRCDPVKKEYVATSLTGTRERVHRFEDCDALMNWALNIPEIMLTHVGELEPGEYFVKVTAESRLRRLPPFIDQLFFFVPQKEYHIEGRSQPFPIGGGAAK